MFFVYLLQSQRDQKYYIGQTNNIEKRLSRHNAGLVTATKGRIPFDLVCYWEFDTRSEAMNYERYLKSLKGGHVFHSIVSEKIGKASR